MSIFRQIKKDKYIGEDRHKEYTDFYNKYYDFMFHRANYKLGGMFHTAEDVVQSCMIEITKERVFDILMKVDERVQRSYITSMVDNRVVDFYRSQKKYELQPNENFKYYEDKSDYLKKDVLKIEFLDMIDNVKNLNTLDKRLIKYVSFYDAKMDELAKICHTTIRGVRKRINKVRDILDDDKFVWQG